MPRQFYVFGKSYNTKFHEGPIQLFWGRIKRKGTRNGAILIGNLLRIEGA